MANLFTQTLIEMRHDIQREYDDLHHLCVALPPNTTWCQYSPKPNYESVLILLGDLITHIDVAFGARYYGRPELKSSFTDCVAEVIRGVEEELAMHPNESRYDKTAKLKSQLNSLKQIGDIYKLYKQRNG